MNKKYNELQEMQILSGNTYLTLGDSEFLLKKYKEAAQDYQKALDKFNLLPNTYEQRALAQNKLREVQFYLK